MPLTSALNAIYACTEKRVKTKNNYQHQHYILSILFISLEVLVVPEETENLLFHVVTVELVVLLVALFAFLLSNFYI
jgi:NADH:ubiquinone oxidoreductase subunit 3 (subunit A)